MTDLADPYAVMRPRRGRAMAIGAGVASLVLFGAVAVLVDRAGIEGWGLVDSLLMFGVGVLIALMMWRFAAPPPGPAPARAGGGHVPLPPPARRGGGGGGGGARAGPPGAR